MLWLGWMLAIPALADDEDNDGWDSDQDCDDDDPSVHPGAPEGCDGIDTNCNGTIPVEERDLDEDGIAQCEGDCDDQDVEVHPDAVELCNGVDDDCDLAVDEGCPTTATDTGGAGPTGGTTGGTTEGTPTDPAPDTTGGEAEGIGSVDRAPDYEPLKAEGTGCTCAIGSTTGAGLRLGPLALLLGITLPSRRRR